MCIIDIIVNSYTIMHLKPINYLQDHSFRGLLADVDSDIYRLLCCVRVRRTGKNLQMCKQGISETALGKHSFDSFLNNTFRNTSAYVPKSLHFTASRPAVGVAEIKFIGFLTTGDCYLVSIDDNNERAHIDRRSISNIVLAADGIGDESCQST